jgi:hypothetical protein
MDMEEERQIKLFQLDSKKVVSVVLAEFAAIILHNLVSAALGKEEALFFILATLVIPLYFIVASIFTLIKYSQNPKSIIKQNKRVSRIIGVLVLVAYGVLVGELTDSAFVVSVFDIISGLSVIGIAVLISPFLTPTNNKLTKTYLLLKLVEGSLMVVGGFVFLSPSLQHIRDWIYAIPHLYTFIVSAYILYWLLYKSKLIPQAISVWGLIAISSLLLQSILGALGITSPIVDALLILIITNEIALAAWLIVKGVNKSALK